MFKTGGPKISLHFLIIFSLSWRTSKINTLDDKSSIYGRAWGFKPCNQSLITIIYALIKLPYSRDCYFPCIILRLLYATDIADEQVDDSRVIS